VAYEDMAAFETSLIVGKQVTFYICQFRQVNTGAGRLCVGVISDVHFTRRFSQGVVPSVLILCGLMEGFKIYALKTCKIVDSPNFRNLFIKRIKVRCLLEATVKGETLGHSRFKTITELFFV
jgi:hypothetical protein